MRKTLLFIILSTLFSLSLEAENVVSMTQDMFKTRVLDYSTAKEWTNLGQKPCIIDFYTTWCGPCKRLAPIMEELAETYAGQIDFYKVDTEQERELAAVFGINSIPQVLYIPADGRPVMLKGLYPKENIVEIIETYLCK